MLTMNVYFEGGVRKHSVPASHFFHYYRLLTLFHFVTSELSE